MRGPPVWFRNIIINEERNKKKCVIYWNTHSHTDQRRLYFFIIINFFLERRPCSKWIERMTICTYKKKKSKPCTCACVCVICSVGICVMAVCVPDVSMCSVCIRGKSSSAPAIHEKKNHVWMLDLLLFITLGNWASIATLCIVYTIHFMSNKMRNKCDACTLLGL